MSLTRSIIDPASYQTRNGTILVPLPECHGNGGWVLEGRFFNDYHNLKTDRDAARSQGGQASIPFKLDESCLSKAISHEESMLQGASKNLDPETKYGLGLRQIVHASQLAYLSHLSPEDLATAVSIQASSTQMRMIDLPSKSSSAPYFVRALADSYAARYLLVEGGREQRCSIQAQIYSGGVVVAGRVRLSSVDDRSGNTVVVGVSR